MLQILGRRLRPTLCLMKMRLYRVLAHGTNFPGVILGEPSQIGFYTTRFVEARSAEDAETEVLARLRAEPALRVDAEHRNTDARVLMEEIEEVPMDTPRIPDQGFTFYRAGEE